VRLTGTFATQANMQARFANYLRSNQKELSEKLTSENSDKLLGSPRFDYVQLLLVEI